MVCDGDPIREEINKPTTDTSLYKVEYIYRTIETLAANIITENILLQVEKEGHRKLLMNVIIDNQTHKDDIKEDDTFYTKMDGTIHCRHTIKGWEICVQWKDGSSNWIALKDLNNSYSLEVADYAVTNII